MNIIVSKDIVKLNENHSENHYGEYNVNECVFEFDEYFDSVPIKKAIFTSQSNNKSFEIDIINNKCTVPHEVLTKVYDTVILGVYGYDVNEETLLVRYSPEPTTFVVHEGSYREGAEQPEIITPPKTAYNNTSLINGLSDMFIAQTRTYIRNNLSTIDNSIAINQNELIIAYKNFSTVEEFKQWLSENNVEVYYQLAKTEIIELGELPEPIKTFEGVNNIQLLANLDTEIEVKYALDVKKYFENKLASIQEQIL